MNGHETQMRMTVTLTTQEAIDLFTVLNKDRDARYKAADNFGAIKEAFCFGELVARLCHAYIHADEVVTDGTP